MENQRRSGNLEPFIPASNWRLFSGGFKRRSIWRCRSGPSWPPPWASRKHRWVGRTLRPAMKTHLWRHICWLIKLITTTTPPPPPQVKIWFQNRRSKFKKLWKSGEIPPEQHVATSDSPPCTSPPNTAWDFPQTPRMSGVNPSLPQSSSPPNTTAPSSFLANYSWYSSTNSATHLQPPLVQHHHNSAISAGTIF